MNVLLIASLLAVCGAASLHPEAYTPSHQYPKQDEIVFQEQTQDSIGNYDYSFETSNGIIVQERGKVINPGTEEQYIEVTGFFSYIDQYDGKEYSVFYKADKGGFQAEGDHLPGAPKISGFIKKGLHFKAPSQKSRNTRQVAADPNGRHQSSNQHTSM